MPKYFVYDDPEMAAHVNNMVSKAKDAEKNETKVRDCQERPKEYVVNNREKPFDPISKDDIEHRYTLSQGGGKDKFTVAKHRAEQQNKFVEKYERLAADRDGMGNFYMSAAQTAKVAKVVREQAVKKQKEMGYLKRIAAAISLSKKAKWREMMSNCLKRVLKKQ